MNRENIKYLCQKVADLVNSPRNQERRKPWDKSFPYTQWQGVPPKDTSYGVPIQIWLEYPMWAKALNFDIKKYYTEGRAYLEAQLQIRIYEFTHFNDDKPIDKTITIWLGSPFELSLFGLMPVYLPDEDPWIPRAPIYP